MVGLFLYIGEKPSTYGLPLSVTFVRPDLNSGVLHSTCRWLQLPPVGDYSPLLYRLHIHPASVRLDHPIKLLQASLPRSFVLHGKALVVKSRGQTSKCSVLTAILAPTQYRRNYTPLAIRALSSQTCCSLTFPMFFFIACHLRAWFFALDSAIVCYAKYMFLYEYICPQQIRVYLIQSFPVQS